MPVESHQPGRCLKPGYLLSPGGSAVQMLLAPEAQLALSWLAASEASQLYILLGCPPASQVGQHAGGLGLRTHSLQGRAVLWLTFLPTGHVDAVCQCPTG